MASQNPPLKNIGYTFYTSLVSQADSRLFQVSPTLAAGDVKVAIDDGAPANLATLPVIDADFTKRIKVVMSSGEMNGDNVTIIFSDAAGAEWCDMTINLQTTTKQFEDIPTAAAIADAVLDDALTQPAATFTWAGATLRTVVAWLGALARNKILETNTLSTLRNDADSADLSTSTVSDDGSVFTRGEWS